MPCKRRDYSAELIGWLGDASVDCQLEVDHCLADSLCSVPMAHQNRAPVRSNELDSWLRIDAIAVSTVSDSVRG